MKKIILLLFTTIIIFSQELRVTDMNGYSVEKPQMAIHNGLVHLTYATNYRYYQFPLTGPIAPISNPKNIFPYQWGPTNVSIAAGGNYVSSLIIDYLSTSGKFILYNFFSNDIGNNWSIEQLVDTVEIGSSITLRNDLPKVLATPDGNFYYLWFNFHKINSNSQLMFSNNFGYIKKEIGDTNYEDAVNMTVRKIINQDYIAITYAYNSIGKTNAYFVISTDGGNTFSQPKIFFSDTNSMGYTNVEQTWVKIMPDLSIFTAISYSKMTFGQPGQHEWQGGTYLFKSTNLGNSWEPYLQIDTVYEYYHSIFDMTDEKVIVKLCRYDNLYLKTTTDCQNWSVSDNLLSIDSLQIYSPTMILDNNKAATAWIDYRTGHPEIYYRYVDIPQAPLSVISSNNKIENFILYQNYPNPFNPSTIIKFVNNKSQNIKISVYDIMGKKVANLLDKHFSAGSYEINFIPNNLNSGVYFAVVETPNFKKSIKMLYLK